MILLAVAVRVGSVSRMAMGVFSGLCARSVVMVKTAAEMTLSEFAWELRAIRDRAWYISPDSGRRQNGGLRPVAVPGKPRRVSPANSLTRFFRYGNQAK